MGKLEDLQKLKELKDSGVLSEEEYEIEKHKVLNEENNVQKANSKNSVKALTGFVLGLCSIMAWVIPLIGFPVTVIGIIFSALGLNSNRRALAIAGLVLSIIFFVVTLINSIVGAAIMSSYYYYY